MVVLVMASVIYAIYLFFCHKYHKIINKVKLQLNFSGREKKKNEE